MNWEIISKIAASLSALIAAGSLFSGFYLYKISQRDKKNLEFRSSLVQARALTKQLDLLLSYELGFENASSIVESKQLQVFLRKVFEKAFSSQCTKEALDEYLGNNMPTIVAPMHSSIGRDFEEKFLALEREASLVEFEFPGAGRILYVAVNILRNTNDGQKRLFQSEDAWKSAIIQSFDSKKSGATEFADFELKLTEMFVGTWLEIMRRNQPNIDDVISALDLIVSRYLNKTGAELPKISRYEKRQDMIPMKDTATIADDMKEAEKCLSYILTQQDILFLRQLSTQIETRSKTE